MPIQRYLEPTQSEMILEYLRKGYSITPLEALKEFGCFRLGARIWELKQRGYNIEMQLSEVMGGKHVAEYRLAKKETGDGRQETGETSPKSSPKTGEDIIGIAINESEKPEGVR